MLQQVGYKNALPGATSLDDAVKTYRKYYSSGQEQEYGVLAIHITLSPTNSATLV